MAAPSYTKDMTDVDLAQAITNWVEPAAPWDVGGAPTADADYPYIEQTLSISQTATKTGLIGLLANAGSGITVPSDGAILIWQNFSSPPAMNTYANGGLRVMVGNSASAFYWWAAGGRDYGRMPYGGWQNHAVNPAVTSGRTAVGSPSGTWQYMGAGVNVTTGIGKGNPHQVDAVRYGRCEARINGGESGNYATFTGFAAQNDSSSNRWGLIQAVPGGFLWKGLLTLGYTSAVDFRDQNTQIIVDDTVNVTAAFNKIEIRQSGSRVDWTNITFKALGTISKGSLEVIDDCDVNILGCVFDGMSTFIFKVSSGVLTSTFRNCGIITAGGATFAGTLFEGFAGAADSSYLSWNYNSDPNNPLNGCRFTKGSTNTHAIGFTASAPTTMTLTNIAFSGYNASNGQDDSTLWFADRGSDTTWTVNLQSCTGNISYKKARAGDTINLVTGQVTVTLTGLKDNTEVRVYAAGTTTQLAGVENASDGSPGARTFAFTLASSTSVDIRIFNIQYEPIEIYAYTIPAANASLPQAQQYDRVYANP